MSSTSALEREGEMCEDKRMFKLNREKYLQILKNDGLPAALTTLHKDSERWEHETFEGPEGWQPEAWEALREVRAFSRELWEIGLGQRSAG
jgi:hypothetical protein